MKRTFGTLISVLGLLAVAGAQNAPSGQEGPDKAAFGPAQTAADLVRETAGADIAFLPAGIMFREFAGDDLSKLVKYPTETIHVSKLTGAQVRQALNRSISLYPSPNSGFLQISGLEVSFDPRKPAGERVTSVTVNGRPLDPRADYQVAMPISLARGGYGYFNVWDKNAIVRNLETTTLESVLKDKKPVTQAPRWKSEG
jgi:2',3'-cyclic-nucleotide 2'-phosphodiesterase (5'-nucleotidase family)